MRTEEHKNSEHRIQNRQLWHMRTEEEGKWTDSRDRMAWNRHSSNLPKQDPKRSILEMKSRQGEREERRGKENRFVFIWKQIGTKTYFVIQSMTDKWVWELVTNNEHCQASLTTPSLNGDAETMTPDPNEIRCESSKWCKRKTTITESIPIWLHFRIKLIWSTNN